MGDSHPSKRQDEIGMISGVLGEPVGGTNCEDEWQRIALLVLAKELREFLGRKLFASRFEKHENAAGAFRFPSAELQERRLVFERNAFSVCKLLEALNVLVCEGLDG